MNPTGMQAVLRRPLAWLPAGLVVAVFALSGARAAAPEGSGERPLGISVAAFAGTGEAGERIAQVARSDLERSGVARIVPAGSFPLGHSDPIAFEVFRERGVDLLVVGTARPADDGRIALRFRLYDVALEQAVGGTGSAEVLSADGLRLGHRVADEAWRQITGVAGCFSSRLALVVRRDDRYLLQVADWDGSNAQTALASAEPVLSPAWSPDGENLAYAVIEGGRPVVYAQSLASGERRVVASAPGSHSAPAWRPDGGGLAVVSSTDGGSRIVEASPEGAGWRRLLRGAGISTEPAYSPDGRFLYFSSDRAGSPQIYRSRLADGAVERLTFEGDYNVSPAVSPDGTRLAFVTRRGERFALALMDLSSGRTRILDDTAGVESPSYAPNGRFVAFVERRGGRGVLAVVTGEGGGRLAIPEADDDVLEAAWGPASP